MSNLEIKHENPLQLFLYALSAPESKRQLPRRLKVLLDYLQNKKQLNCTALDDQCKEFVSKTGSNIILEIKKIILRATWIQTNWKRWLKKLITSSTSIQDFTKLMTDKKINALLL